jgi:hypothetical protein
MKLGLGPIGLGLGVRGSQFTTLVVQVIQIQRFVFELLDSFFVEYFWLTSISETS